MSEYPLDWIISNLGAHLTETKERAGDSSSIPYSVSKVLGIVPQSEKFNKRVASSDISNYKVIREGDFAYDPMLLWDGSINRMLREGKGAVSPAYVTFRVTSNTLDADYLLHLLKANTTKTFYKSISKGTNVRRQKAEFCDFAGGEFAFPPLPEQKKIAEILSGIDLRIRLGKHKIAQLESLLRSLGDNFFEHKSQSETKTIGEIFEVSSGTTPSRSRQDYFCTNGGTPWVKTMDLTDDFVRNTDEQLTSTGIQEGKARIFPKGTLLIAMYGGWNQIGRTGILAQDSSCNQAMSALLPAKEVSPEFLNLQLVIRRSYWKGVAASSRKDPNITKADVTNMPIVIPSPDTQAKISTALGSVLRRKINEHLYLESLNLLKDALASDLLSGRKRVSV